MVALISSYDDLQRLTAANRGELVAAKDRITDHALAQTWNLDATGNWKGFTNFDQATPANDLVQQRTTNAANEITDITETVGNQWKTPVHDRAGNMTKLPQPDTPTSEYTCTYDAWNRLVKVKDGGATVSTYEYDGLNRRIVKFVEGGATDSYQHIYYNAAWQVLETRESDALTPIPTTAQYQYVWSLRYIDAPVLRDEIVSGGSNDVRLYYTGDANFNVTSLFDHTGDAVERYVYDPYGNVTIYNADWTATQAPTVHNNSTLYTGQWRDAETGLSNYRRRYYHALLGLFIIVDPMSYASGTSNLYQYASSSPPDTVDPSGMIDFAFGFFDKTTIDKTVKRTFYVAIGPGSSLTGTARQKSVDLTVPNGTKEGDYIIGGIIDAPRFSNRGMREGREIQRRKGIGRRIYARKVAFTIDQIRNVYEVTRVETSGGKITVCKGVLRERLAKVDTSQWTERRYRDKVQFNNLPNSPVQTFWDTLEPFGNPDRVPEWAWWKIQGLEILPPYRGRIPLEAFDSAIPAKKPANSGGSRERFRQSGRSILRFRRRR